MEFCCASLFHALFGRGPFALPKIRPFRWPGTDQDEDQRDDVVVKGRQDGSRRALSSGPPLGLLGSVSAKRAPTTHQAMQRRSGTYGTVGQPSKRAKGPSRPSGRGLPGAGGGSRPYQVPARVSLRRCPFLVVIASQASRRPAPGAPGAHCSRTRREREWIVSVKGHLSNDESFLFPVVVEFRL